MRYVILELVVSDSGAKSTEPRDQFSAIALGARAEGVDLVGSENPVTIVVDGVEEHLLLCFFALNKRESTSDVEQR